MLSALSMVHSDGAEKYSRVFYATSRYLGTVRNELRCIFMKCQLDVEISFSFI